MKAGDGRHFANFNYSLHAFANRSLIIKYWKIWNENKGSKSSERNACYHAFYSIFCPSCLRHICGSDLSSLGILIGTVAMPLMWYAGARTALK